MIITTFNREKPHNIMSLRPFIEELNTGPLPELSLSFFLDSYHSIQSRSHKSIKLRDYKPISTVPKLETLPTHSCPQRALDKVVYVKLNGGLATTFNSQHPKSSLLINHSDTFLESFIKQVKTAPAPIVLMNSPHTERVTRDSLKQTQDLDISFVTQSKFPRLHEHTLDLFHSKTNPQQNWNPIGHAEVLSLLYESGLCHTFLSQGREYLFISNIDNLSATFSPSILAYLESEKLDFLMEVTPKTAADRKGGIITQDETGLKLVEIAQVSPTDLDLFYNTTHYNFFNTNTIWISIDSLIKSIDNKTLQTDLIINRKTIDNTPIIQVESAMGSAIQSFKKSGVLNVPRHRFNPVKSINELIALHSDLYTWTQGAPHQSVDLLPTINCQKSFPSVDDFYTHFTTPPSLKNARSIHLSGPFSCQKDCQFIGDVHLSSTTRKELSESQYYENCLLTFN